MVLKLKRLFTIENLLLFSIIICPILDIVSFLFRKKFETNYSISTFLRPIIPMFVFVYLFFKNKGKTKKIGIIVLYMLYALIHIFLYYKMTVGCTFGSFVHEAQYIVNYSFMILNFYIFRSVFSYKYNNKLSFGVLISLGIYTVLIYLSIITKTSSTTYIEGIGYKGWFESGNSVSAILVLSTFIIMSFIMKIINPNKPALVPINILKNIPTNTNIGITNILYFLSFTYGKYMNIVNKSIALMLFPDSNQPL